MTTTITESVGLQARPGHRYRARLIEGERWGSSGYYGRDMLERDGPQVWPAGTQVYMDHPGVTEQHDRPERSVRDLAGKITSTPVYEADGLYADIEFYPHIAPVIEAMWEDVGMSIRAAGTAETGERDGRTGAIITSLSEGVSVDVVTRAGAGGKLVALLESARATVHESLPGGLVANDLEQRLDDMVGPEAWVVDFTDEWLVYRTWDGDDRALVQQSYVADEQGRITLTGTPQRVSRRVTYDAHNPPATSAGVAMESHQKEEPIMAQIQIDEAEHKRLTETADKVAAMEAERDAATKRAEEADAKIAEADKKAETSTVSRIVGEAGVEFSKWERAGIESALPRTEDGALDEAAFTERVKEAATEKAAVSGHGRPHGLGHISESTTDYTEADLDGVLGIQKGA
ncbi:MAG: hypothetical protein L0G94_10685 [Brachybacterium sp.]|uniref:hypothetical protein n=1 Tax=Brachybacterium sp. TaxID=1891286 RepID=UPI0026476774|nr:hypothetical protein [Brachybacterium sp.]MDN5687122.1 hypothetical protein [Brachybacterium sp.]